MSYILDALKKSDQERQRGAVPGMRSLQTTPGPERKSWGKWPILLATILLVGAGSLAWWRISPMSGGPTGDSATQVPEGPSAESSAGTGAAQAVERAGQPPNPAIPPSEQPSPKAEDPKTKGNSPDPTPGVARTPTPEPFSEPRVAKGRREAAKKPAAKLSSPAGTDEPTGRSQRPSSQVVASKSPPQDSSSKILTEMEKAATGGTTPSQDALKSSPATAGKPGNTIPELRELPPAVQREIPSMSFSMLVYSEVSRDRMIRINGKLLREGDEVASGLKLEEIVPGGAVFSFKGQRFKKGVF